MPPDLIGTRTLRLPFLNDDLWIVGHPWESTMARIALVVACASCLALAGCRSTEVGGPVSVPLPHNLTEDGAQTLVTRFIGGLNQSAARAAKEDPLRGIFASARSRRSLARRYRGKWRVESWNPGSMVAAYAWRRHVLRVRLDFADHTMRLAIGEGTNLDQTETRIHRTAKALAMELEQEIRFVFGNVAALDAAAVATWQERASRNQSFCGAIWSSDAAEKASCERAQRRSYDRLRPYIDLSRIKPHAGDSQRLTSCYARSQTRSGTDWESTERCFHSSPASMP